MYFRLELLLLSFGILIFVIFVFILFVLGKSIGVAVYISDFSRIAWDHYVLFIAPCFALAITYYNDISVCIMNRRFANSDEEQGKSSSSASVSSAHGKIDLSKYNPTVEAIELILTREETFKLFEQFAACEYSIENISCFRDIRKYKTLKSQKKRFKQATNIYYAFLDKNAALEINVPRPIIEAVRKKLVGYDTNTCKLEPNLFDEIETAILYNLTDMYTRFFKSAAFKRFLLNNKVTTVQDVPLQNVKEGTIVAAQSAEGSALPIPQDENVQLPSSPSGNNNTPSSENTSIPTPASPTPLLDENNK